MGGKGSGGQRSGAGRPRISAVPARRRHEAEKGADPVAPQVVQDAPVATSAGFLTIWNDLAPRATAEGTLVESTQAEFRAMVELAVEHRRCHKALTEASTGQDSYLGLLRIYLPLTQRLEAKMRAFRLAPMGKPIATEKPKQKSALDRLKEQRHTLHAIK